MVKNYKIAFFVFVAFFLVLTKSFWLEGEVLSHTRQHHELMINDIPASLYVENGKFADFNRVYLPEIRQYITAPRSGSIALWTNQNELGRPLHQLSGFGPSYFPFYLLLQFSDNPWVLITILSLVLCFLSGIFILLFCRELLLSPIAGLVAALMLATSPLFLYWLTFPMFLSTYCWSAGILFSTKYLFRKFNFFVWLLLVFCIYSLLLTGYPQSVVHQLYVLVGYVIYMAFLNWRKTCHVDVINVLILLVVAFVFGLVLVFPVYWDLINTTLDSARLKPDLSFFAPVVVKFLSLKTFWQFTVLSTSPEIFGNPISSLYPLSYDGISLTYVMIFFIVVAVIGAFKKIWGWLIPILVSFLLATYWDLYVIAIKYLGFGLSRGTPLSIMVLPIIIVIAYGVDEVACYSYKKCKMAIVCAGLFCLMLLISGITFGVVYSISLNIFTICYFIFLVMLLVFYGQKIVSHYF